MKHGYDRDYDHMPDELVSEVVGYQYTDEGVKILKENNVGGVWSCTWNIVEWGERTEVSPCASCGRLHDVHNPSLCHSCRF